MGSRLQRTLLGLMVLLALAGSVAFGIWLNGRLPKKSAAARSAAETESASRASRMATVIQKKAESSPPFKRPAPPEPAAPDSAEPAATSRKALIKGQLVDSGGNPVTMEMVVFSPEGRFSVNAVNGRFETGAVPGVLRIVGQYRSGMRVLQTPALRVNAAAGETTEVALVVDVPPPVGTPGFHYKTAGDWLEITSVDPGGAAAEAAMAPGDAVIEIGGHPVKDLDPAMLADLLNGPPGSTIAVTVVAETAEGRKDFPLVLERRAPVK